MYATKIGKVIIEAEKIRVEDWEFSLDSTDSPNVSTEQLLAEYAAKWALGRLTDAVNQAMAEAIKRNFGEKSQKTLGEEN